MTHPATLAPFYRRNGTTRELTFADFLTITKMPRGQALAALSEAVAQGAIQRDALHDRHKTAIYAVAGKGGAV